MGRKSRFVDYMDSISKTTSAKNATVRKTDSIKNRIREMKIKSKKGVK